jgi:hypothetical protein
MSNSLVIGTWVEIRDGCPIQFEVGGSGVAFVHCGTHPDDCFRFTLDSEALRDFVGRGTEALREMDAMYAREEENGA